MSRSRIRGRTIGLIDLLIFNMDVLMLAARSYGYNVYYYEVLLATLLNAIN